LAKSTIHCELGQLRAVGTGLAGRLQFAQSRLLDEEVELDELVMNELRVARLARRPFDEVVEPPQVRVERVNGGQARDTAPRDAADGLVESRTPPVGVDEGHQPLDDGRTH
jgi:hypothetical protein